MQHYTKIHQIIEYSGLEGTHQDQEVQHLALHRTPHESHHVSVSGHLLKHHGIHRRSPPSLCLRTQKYRVPSASGRNMGKVWMKLILIILKR